MKKKHTKPTLDMFPGTMTQKAHMKKHYTDPTGNLAYKICLHTNLIFQKPVFT